MLPMCIACHGADGISNNPTWPHLTAQHKSYLLKQLHDFKQGKTRASTIMTPILATISDEELQELAQYYAAQSKHPAKKIIPKHNSRGESLYRYGDRKLHIPACMTCHGPTGIGNAQAGFPDIAGQNSIYTIQQLQAFKTHQRHNDLNSIMQEISSRMTEEDYAEVAKYIQNLA
jgi:cytochrome c553